MKKFKNLVLLILCGITFFAFACGSSSDTTTSSDDGGTQSGKNNLQTYSLGEDIYITNSSGKYRLKFNSVTETGERNQFSDKQANRVIIVEYEYENMTIESDLLVSDMLNFKVYDKENNKLETYPVDTTYGGSVGMGRKTVSTEAYALNSENNYIEIEYYDNLFNSKPDCKIVVEW